MLSQNYTFYWCIGQSWHHKIVDVIDVQKVVISASVERKTFFHLHQSSLRLLRFIYTPDFMVGGCNLMRFGQDKNGKLYVFELRNGSLNTVSGDFLMAFFMAFWYHFSDILMTKQINAFLIKEFLSRMYLVAKSAK